MTDNSKNDNKHKTIIARQIDSGQRTEPAYIIQRKKYRQHRQLFGFLGFLQRPEHCLHHMLLNSINRYSMELRDRDHSFLLIRCKYILYKTHSFYGVCSNT